MSLTSHKRLLANSSVEVLITAVLDIQIESYPNRIVRAFGSAFSSICGSSSQLIPEVDRRWRHVMQGIAPRPVSAVEFAKCGCDLMPVVSKSTSRSDSSFGLWSKLGTRTLNSSSCIGTFVSRFSLLAFPVPVLSLKLLQRRASELNEAP